MIALSLPEVYLLVRRLASPGQYQPSNVLVLVIVGCEIGMLVVQSMALLTTLPQLFMFIAIATNIVHNIAELVVDLNMLNL